MTGHASDPSVTPHPGLLKPPADLPRSIVDLRASGWESVPVAEEMRRNTAKLIAADRPLVPGVLGFEETVVPQLENAVLAGHDLILLGERGQAKTRVIRSLVGLLDEWLPIVEGSEINDDPYNPVSRFAIDRVDELGEATPVSWVHRSQRYGEKLATPDTSIADLIGEVDPIKIAEGRYLSDELALHYGLIPRVNRGVFAINELPDLSERIQVGLLNILEERDVQIRGHRIRLPLDIMLVATANPEDYTNRGRIITPLKDRFGAQIRTHYPFETQTEVKIMEAEADLPTAGVPVTVPSYMKEVIAEVSQLARRSTHLNQRSGVSVRLSIANYETLVASSVRRALRTGEPVAVPVSATWPRSCRRPPARSRSRPWRRATRTRWWPSSWRRPRCRSSGVASPSTTRPPSSAPSTTRWWSTWATTCRRRPTWRSSPTSPSSSLPPASWRVPRRQRRSRPH